ncbi:peptidase domain-containing ABC transporter [Pseudoruminococcus massiliensis]|uniref:peptidase domain-containing ABC transporter n=1 Tax=Pseudoruminococcus massiliensis TaxID=2086583 RepID=UPI003AB2D5C5
MFKLKCILQNDETDCGPACLAAIFGKYGLKVSIAKIRDIAGTDRQGTSACGLVKVIEHYGFEQKVVEADKNALTQKLPLPAIAHVVIDNTLLHYVVITKIKDNTVVVSDPAKGSVRYKKEDFLKIWTNVLILIAPTKESQKGNKKESTLSSFFRLLISQKWLLLRIFILSMILTSIGIITSFYYQVLMDNIVPSLSIEMLNYVSAITLSLFLVQICLNFFRGLLIVKLEQNIDIPIMLGYYNHALILPMKFYSMRDTGEIISRFNDASSIRDIVSEASLTIMMDTIMAVVGAVVLFNSNRLLFLISVVMLILYGIIVFVYNKPIKKINRKIMEMNSKVTSQFVETINGIETIKAFNQEDNEKEKTDKLYKKFLKKVFNGGVLSLSQQTITMFVAVVGELVILWVGVAYVIKGELTLGELITFNALLGYFIEPIKNLINLQPSIQTAVVAADRLGEILDITPEYNYEHEQLNDKIRFDKISISNLDFRYGTRELVLKDINLEICRGEKIAFVGESGSGKTTLANLLVRLYEQEKGSIKLDSIDIREFSIKQIRDNISYISQNTFLFSGTIRENLLFGNSDVSDDDISQVCKICELEEYINSLPLKFNTRIEENGKNLSGGQKQRLAIARALLKKPEILIMDEATSNLDYITERSIEKTINNFSKNMTTIIIAHRLSTIKDCDKIFVLRNAQIVETGNHRDLLNQRGYYYQLWNGQDNIIKD